MEVSRGVHELILIRIFIGKPADGGMPACSSDRGFTPLLRFRKTHGFAWDAAQSSWTGEAERRTARVARLTCVALRLPRSEDAKTKRSTSRRLPSVSELNEETFGRQDLHVGDGERRQEVNRRPLS